MISDIFTWRQIFVIVKLYQVTSACDTIISQEKIMFYLNYLSVTTIWILTVFKSLRKCGQKSVRIWTVEFHNNLLHSTRRRTIWEHFFTNSKFVWENSIFHLFPNVDRFSKNIFIFKDWTIKKNIFQRTRILRWLGRENEENLARTRNCSGWPSSPY